MLCKNRCTIVSVFMIKRPICMAPLCWKRVKPTLRQTVQYLYTPQYSHTPYIGCLHEVEIHLFLLEKTPLSKWLKENRLNTNIWYNNCCSRKLKHCHNVFQHLGGVSQWLALPTRTRLMPLMQGSNQIFLWAKNLIFIFQYWLFPGTNLCVLLQSKFYELRLS